MFNFVVHVTIDTILQPLYKGQLQRLLLNLCAHIETRTALIKILMDLLMLDMRKSSNHLNASEPSYRLYACQSHVMYSRPQFFDGMATFHISHCLVCKCYLPIVIASRLRNVVKVEA